MRAVGVQKKLLGLFLATITVLTIMGVFIHLSIQDRETYRWVTRTYDVQARLATTLFDVETALDAHEDFSINHRPEALATFHESFRKAVGDLAMLERLLTDNSLQRIRFRILQSDILEYKDALEASSGVADPVARAQASVREFNLLERVHRSAERMIQEEQDTLERRTQDNRASQRRVNIALAVFLVVVSLLLVYLFVAVKQDLMQQRAMEAEREQAARQELLHREAQRRNQELQALARRLVEMQEAERGHLAYELHEEIGQVLAGLKLSLAGILKQPESMRDEQVRSAQELVTDLMRHVRALSLDLRPGVLDDLGLRPALDWYCRHYAEQAEVSVDFATSGLENRLDGTVETTAYRIVQEALSSLTHQSGVKAVEVRLSREEDYLQVRITDRCGGSAGRDPLCCSDSASLTSMQERATLIGGTFEVTSSDVASGSDQETVITVRLPLSPIYTSLES